MREQNRYIGGYHRLPHHYYSVVECKQGQGNFKQFIYSFKSRWGDHVKMYFIIFYNFNHRLWILFYSNQKNNIYSFLSKYGLDFLFEYMHGPCFDSILRMTRPCLLEMFFIYGKLRLQFLDLFVRYFRLPCCYYLRCALYEGNVIY